MVQVALAPPGPHEVEVTIAAAGVCHSDLHMVRGEWTHRTPVVLGHEGSGVITAVGIDVRDLAVGDHVVLSWVPSCGECRYCRTPGGPRSVLLTARPVGVCEAIPARRSGDGAG